MKFLLDAAYWMGTKPSRGVVLFCVSALGIAAVFAAACLTAPAPVSPRSPVGLKVTLMPPGPAPVPDNLSYAVRAIEHVREVSERDGFELNTARCWWEGDYALCGLCFRDLNRERRMLGAALVKCDQARCYWPLDASEHERVGWNGEPECFAEDWKE